MIHFENRTGCVCESPGFCAKHGMEKTIGLFALCRMKQEKFDEWERGEGIRQNRSVSSPVDGNVEADIADNFPCIHRGDVQSVAQCGCHGGSEAPVHACDQIQHEQCTPRYAAFKSAELRQAVMACSTCPHRQRLETPIYSNADCCLMSHRGEKATEMQGVYRGASAFLVLGGPSTNRQDLAALTRRGILVASVNNAGAGVVRPNIWFSVDRPSKFHDAIWKDPTIMKIVKWAWRTQKIRERKGDDFHTRDRLLKQYPNTWFIQSGTGWNPNTFLTDPIPTWGFDSNQGDVAPEGYPARSVMLIALRMLYWLGVRRLYLLGADFRMTEEQPYAFDTSGSAAKARSNNKVYRWLNNRLAEVRPHFERYGYRVVNCTPDSGLTAFPAMSLDEAIKECLAWFPERIDTAGWYDKE